jgi:hypothetical protein
MTGWLSRKRNTKKNQQKALKKVPFLYRNAVVNPILTWHKVRAFAADYEILEDRGIRTGLSQKSVLPAW